MHAHHGPGVHSFFRTQRFDEEFGGAVQGFGMIDKSLRAAQVPDNLHDAGYFAEISEILFGLGENVQRAGAKGRLALLDADLAQHPRTACWFLTALSQKGRPIPMKR